MDIVNDQLLAGHSEGAFVIKDESASKFIEDPGFWTFEEYKGDNNKIQFGNDLH